MEISAKLTAVSLPRNPQRHEASQRYAAYAEEHFAPTVDGCKSLLRSLSQRLPAVAPTVRSLLAKLVRERQGVYAAFLGRLMSGASVSGAAVACGIRRESVRDWLAKGLSDQQVGTDSYYARFASDVHSAIAFCVSECEIQVATRKPLEYLRTGPGRAFYAREQYWQQLDPRLPLPESDLEPLVEVALTEQAAIPPDRTMAALDALKQLGIIQHPEFAHQLADQSGHPNTDTSGVGVSRASNQV